MSYAYRWGHAEILLRLLLHGSSSGILVENGKAVHHTATRLAKRGVLGGRLLRTTTLAEIACGRCGAGPWRGLLLLLLHGLLRLELPMPNAKIL